MVLAVHLRRSEKSAPHLVVNPVRDRRFSLLKLIHLLAYLRQFVQGSRGRNTNLAPKHQYLYVSS